MTISNGYIELPVTTDSQTLIQQAMTNIADKKIGWVPREGHLEVLLLEQLADMVAEAASVAGQVPLEIFQYMGNLLGVTPNYGTSAQIGVTVTLTAAPSSSAFVLPAGSQAVYYSDGNQYLFSLDSAITIAVGQTTGSGTMTAAVPGISYNNLLQNGSYINMVVPSTQIASVQVNNASLTAGTDAETTDAYMDRLAAELALMSPRPITADDFAALASSYSAANVYRASAYDGLNPFINLLSTETAYPNTTVGNWTAVGNASLSALSPGLQVALGAASGVTRLQLASAPSAAATTLSVSAVTGITAGQALTMRSWSSDGVTAVVNASGIIGSSSSVTGGTGAFTSFASTGFASIVCNNGTAVFNFTKASGTSLTINYWLSGVNTTWTWANNATVTELNLAAGEPVVVSSVNSSTNVLTLTSPLTFNHNATNLLPTLTIPAGATTSVFNLSSNHDYVGMVDVSEPVATAGWPVLTLVSTYSDGSKVVTNSNLNTPQDYVPSSTAPTVPYGQLTATAARYGSSPLVPSPPSGSSQIAPNCTISSVAMSVYWCGATPSTNKNIRFGFLGQNDGSALNLLPDSTLRAFKETNNQNPSWLIYSTLKFFAMAGIGLQYVGDGTPSGTMTAQSPFFNLKPGNYTFFTSMSLSASDLTSGYITLDVVNSAGTSLVTSNYTPGLTVGPTRPTGTGYWVSNFTVPSPTTTAQSATALSASSSTTLTVGSNAAFPASGTITIVHGGTNYTASYSGLTGTTVLNGVQLQAGTTGFTTTVGDYIAPVNPMSGDCQVVVKLNNVTITTGVSVLFSEMQVVSGTIAPGSPTLTSANYIQSPAWTAGGQPTPALYSTPRMVTLVPVHEDGSVLSDSEHNNLMTYFANQREINFSVNVIDPNYVPIDIQYTASAALGYDPTTLQTYANGVLERLINPATWGGGDQTPPFWDNTAKTLYCLALSGYIDDAPGMAAIQSFQIKLASGSTWKSDSLTLPGIAPLPIVNSISAIILPSTSSVFEVG